MKKNNQFQKKILFLILGVIVFYGVTLGYSDLEKLSIAVQKIQYEYYIIVVILIILRTIIFAYRFHLLVNKIGISLTFRDSCKIYLAGLSMIITPGGIGALIKSHILKNKTGHSYSSTSSIIIYEKWLDATAIIIMISLLLVWVTMIESIAVIGVGIVVNIILFSLMKGTKGIGKINQIVEKISFLKNKTINIKEYGDAVNKLSNTKNNVCFVLLSLIPKIITGAIVFLIFRSFGLELDIFTTSQIFFTSQLIGILSLIPGGIIITDSSLLGLLLIQGMEFSDASILVVIIRFWSIWVMTIIGFIFIKFAFNNQIIDSQD